MGQRDLEQIGEDEEDKSEKQRDSNQRQRNRSHQPSERRQQCDHADVEKCGKDEPAPRIGLRPEQAASTRQVEDRLGTAEYQPDEEKGLGFG